MGVYPEKRVTFRPLEKSPTKGGTSHAHSFSPLTETCGWPRIIKEI